MVYVKELDIFLSVKVLENTPAVLSLGKLCVKNGYSNEWINGQKPHLIKNGIRIQCDTENFVPIVVPGLSTSQSSSSHHAISRTPSRQESDYPTSSSSSSSSPTISSSDNETREKEDQTENDTSPMLVSSTNVGGRTEQPVVDQANQNLPKTNEKETKIERGNPLFSDSGHAGSEIQGWLQEFKEILVYDEGPECRDSHASSSHESIFRAHIQEKWGIRVSTVSILISLKTKITRAPCRRRIGGAVPRAENFGDLITADHKVLSENCESPNNHRYAVAVQDLATQWIQSYPCKNKTSQETQRSLQQFLEPDRKPKVILHWQFFGIWQSLWRSLLESLHVDTTQIRNKWDCWKSSAHSKKKAPLLYCCNQVWKLVGRFHGMLYLSAKHWRSLARWENSIRKSFWRTF